MEYYIKPVRKVNCNGDREVTVTESLGHCVTRRPVNLEFRIANCGKHRRVSGNQRTSGQET